MCWILRDRFPNDVALMDDGTYNFGIEVVRSKILELIVAVEGFRRAKSFEGSSSGNPGLCHILTKAVHGLSFNKMTESAQ